MHSFFGVVAAFTAWSARCVAAAPIHASFPRTNFHKILMDEGIGEELEDPNFWLKIGFSILLILLGGAFAGLTIGLMGLDPLHLQVLAAAADDPLEKKDAKQVLSLMRKGKHWVLVTLLLCNVIVNESLPIFLDSAIGGGIAAIFISTATIVIFGEIIPQAVCARYGLAIGARSAKYVLVMMYLLSPVAYPIAKLLDRVLGEEGPTTYKKAELKSFLQFHRNPKSDKSPYNRAGEESPLPLSDEEISILNGVLSLNEKKVKDIMTPMEDVVTLSADELLGHDLVDKILTSGYSRIPVHEPGKPLSFIGFLLVKRLLMYDSATPTKVGNIRLSVLPEAKPTINCFQALDYFQTGRAHLLLVSNTPGQAGGAIGVITLEDIIEEIISEEIVDETDMYEDMHTKRRAKRQTTAAVMRGIVERERERRRKSDADVSHSYPNTISVPSTPLWRPASAPDTPAPIDTHAQENTRLLTPIEETHSSPGSRTGSEGDGIAHRNLKPGGYGAIPTSESPKER